ncbi:Phosphate-selective porin [Rickettsiales bacterium Ac37b]|nr:Phosphate-selective porin [Rickettsiales bacterium Ac37b]
MCFLYSSAYASDKELLKRIDLLEQKVQKLEKLLADKETASDIKTKVYNNHKPNDQILDNHISRVGKNSDTTIQINPFPKIESEDKKTSIAVNALLQNDLALFTHEKSYLKEGAIVRNARISMRGKLYEDWSYFLQANLAKSDANPTYALISYSFSKNFTLSVGKMCEVFGLDNSTYNSNTFFLEKAAVHTITPNNKTGVMAVLNGEDWLVTLGGFGNYTNEEKSRVYRNYYSGSTRMTYSPIHNGNDVIHMGINANYQHAYKKFGKAEYKSRGESEISPYVLNTGIINNVDNIQSYGVEFATAKGPFVLETEYVTNMINRYRRKSVNFSGGYLQLAWVLTGEKREYSVQKGIFGGVIPSEPFNIKDGTKGAWEIALRYNYLNLNDKKANIYGGAMNNITLGLNWYPNYYIKIMANYAFIKTNRYSVTPNRPQVLMLRTQIGF